MVLKKTKTRPCEALDDNPAVDAKFPSVSSDQDGAPSSQTRAAQAISTDGPGGPETQINIPNAGEHANPLKAGCGSKEESGSVPHCRYHELIMRGAPLRSFEHLSPMERLLAEGSSEEYALYIREDNGKLSTDKGCLCLMLQDCVLEISDDEFRE